MTVAVTNTGSASIAQTFTVSAPAGVSGIYVRDIDLFFQSVSSTFGVSLALTGLTNGLPDPVKNVAGATCVLAAGIPVASSDGSTATKFSFNDLVFLQSNTTYAMTVRALGATPDYQLWTAKAGDTDLSTGATVSSNPASGSLYYAKNSNVWSEVPDEDLKYVIYRAQFDISDVAWAQFVKAKTELMKLANTNFLSGPVDILSGDEVFGLNSAQQANTSMHAVVHKYDETNNLLYCKNSTGNFAQSTPIQIVRTAAEGNLVNATLQALAVIGELVDTRADGIVAKVGAQTDSMTLVSYQFLGTTESGSTPVLDSSYRSIPVQTEQDFSDASRYVLSRSNEVTKLGGNSSVQLQVSMASQSDYVSPILNLKDVSMIGYTNKINADISGEEGDYGAALTRYIGETVTLADGMDAETLTVWLDAFKPAGTEVYVYAKIWNDEDATVFDSEPWTLLQQVSNLGVFSDPKNSNDYIEYSYQFPNAFSGIAGTAWQPVSGPNLEAVQYQNSNGSFSTFRAFAIKVILATTGSNGNIVPILNDIRAIASML